jgi:hypothetical protein
LYEFFVGEDERKHKQGNGNKNEEEGKYRIKTGRCQLAPEIHEKKKNKIMAIIFSNKGKIIFSKMDKFK